MENNEKGSVSLDDLAKTSGLSPVTCPHCGKPFQVTQALRALWDNILRAVDGGKRVLIPNFGVFVAKLLKGHAVSTPLVPDVSGYDDVHALRFRQSKHTRDFLNRGRKTAKGLKKK